ncbi:MAG: radical SAM protein [Acidobacteriota bacterium]
MSALRPPLQFVLKVASRCNLNCSYCYVYNKGDSTWRSRPSVMPDAVFTAAVGRIRRYCEASGQAVAHVVFHGGEPCLVGASRLRRWCGELRTGLRGVATPRFAIQTNGTLVDQEWIDVFRDEEVQVGVSIDGDAALHDAFRVDHLGRGSHAQVEEGIRRLLAAGLSPQVLSVIPLSGDGLRTYEYFRALDVRRIHFLLPDYTHDTKGSAVRHGGSTPVADFLMPVVEKWCLTDWEETDVPLFRQIAELVLGGSSRSDQFGNGPLGIVFVEADGDIEGLDVLRVCADGAAAVGLSVLRDDFEQIAAAGDLHARAIFEGLQLPAVCGACPERETCGGGYLPHRFSKAAGFDNASIWCADILRLFDRMRSLLAVSVEETASRQTVLRQRADSETLPGRVSLDFDLSVPEVRGLLRNSAPSQPGDGCFPADSSISSPREESPERREGRSLTRREP